MRKKIVRIPKSAALKCPNCGKKSRIQLNSDTIYYFECRKCKQKIETPVTQCCIVCAFSNKKCHQSLLQEARMKGLEIRQDKKPETTDKTQTVILIDENIKSN